MSFETNFGSTVSRIESLFQQTTSDTHHSLGTVIFLKVPQFETRSSSQFS